jgi:hypothetical protein
MTAMRKHQQFRQAVGDALGALFRHRPSKAPPSTPEASEGNKATAAGKTTGKGKQRKRKGE